MNTVTNSQVSARNSSVCRLLSNEDKTFALDRVQPRIFDQLVNAARCGFPRSLLVVGKSTLTEAVTRGETLSPRSLELSQMLDKALRTPALLRSFH